MSYENCYEILSNVRQGLDEYSTAFVNGTDTTGAFLNGYLIKNINRAQRYIHSLCVRRNPKYFLTSKALTSVSSVFTLPWDFGKHIYFVDENGLPVEAANPDDLKLVGSAGSDSIYLRKGNTYVLDKDSVTKTYTLYYEKKPRDITMGTDATGGTTKITMSGNGLKNIDDYYNGMIVENVTQDHFDTITDYTGSTGVAVIANTTTAADYYGIVPEIPEMFHDFIAPRALHIIKAENPKVKERLHADEPVLWMQELKEALLAFTDVEPPENLFYDFGPGANQASGVFYDS